jgi:hypothetical protein
MKYLIFLFVLLIQISFSQPKYSFNGLEVENRNGPLKLIIEKLSQDASRIGLTKDRIKTKCELRLRQAGIGISSETLANTLYVNINVGRKAFSCSLEFRRLVNYTVGKIQYETIATTWQDGGHGLHGEDSKYTINFLDELLDKFLNDFLATNVKNK